MPIRPAVIGNWKMNGTGRELKLIRQLADFLARRKTGADVFVCPPATLIARAAGQCKGTKLKIGAQNCHSAANGPHTGDVSAAMLKEAGAKAVILGHSERRAGYGETDGQVRAKAEAVLAAGLKAVICVGETRRQYDRGRTLQVVGRQLKASLPAQAGPQNTLIAYEPVWAIGSGRTPKPEEIVRTHAHLRKTLLKTDAKGAGGYRLLYGGSVSAANAAGILALDEVNGALVGGASLKFRDFSAILSSL